MFSHFSKRKKRERWRVFPPVVCWTIGTEENDRAKGGGMLFIETDSILLNASKVGRLWSRRTSESTWRISKNGNGKICLFKNCFRLGHKIKSVSQKNTTQYYQPGLKLGFLFFQAKQQLKSDKLHQDLMDGKKVEEKVRFFRFQICRREYYV